MSLVALKLHWERLGRRDPYWAILTDSDKRRGGWDQEQFFKTGVEEIAAVLTQAERLGLRVSRRRALDFGCGVGRLTQAMADHFERCDGVDISAAMLRLARRHNRHPETCSYHLNAAPDLRLFADQTFDFVYSTLVLQHMEPKYSKRYIEELLRVLAPHGLLVFQLPGGRIALETPTTLARSTANTGELPVSAFRARLASDGFLISARGDDRIPLVVTVENVSSHNWPAVPGDRGNYEINVGNQWLDGDGHVLVRDDARCSFPHDVTPGSRVEVTLRVTPPRSEGIYWLEVDLVQENVSWFGQRGSETLRIPCRVDGGVFRSLAPDEVPDRASRPKSELRFRERHPRLFLAFRMTGLRDVYWATRRILDRVKSRRDRALGPLKAPVVNWWKRRPFAAKMEMHCVPSSEVLALLAASGGRVVHQEKELTPDYVSFRYWVVR